MLFYLFQLFLREASGDQNLQLDAMTTTTRP